MLKEEQTDELKIHVYNTTLNFVRKYQPHYYKQFRGAQEDLALEFFCQFMTPKSRTKGKEETLLDKFNPKVTSLEYLLKVSTIRMLIDRSRQDMHPVTSIDNFVDEFGDVIIKSFGLSTEDAEVSIDEFTFTPDLIECIRARYQSLKFEARKALYNYYQEVRNIISPAFRQTFDLLDFSEFIKVVEEPKTEILYFAVNTTDGIINAPCQQVTDKTVCLCIESQILFFDRKSGAGRGANYRSWNLTPETLTQLTEIDIFKSGFSREEFINKINNCVVGML